MLIDQVRALEKASVSASVATINLCLLAVWMCRNNANRDWILAWLTAKVVLSLCMILIDLRQNRISIDSSNVLQRLRRSVAFPAINGFAWAAGLLLMWEPNNLDLQLLLLMFSLGQAFASILALRTYLPALFMFFLPCMGSILLATLWQYDKNSLFIVLAVVTFIIWATQHGIIEHRKMINALSQHYEVAELAGKLKEQIDIAETATEAKSRFLAAASHDMRQPMHALNLYLGALANFDLPSSARPVLDKVRECAQTMDEMFAALLDISRLDASVLQANFTVFPVSVVLDKVYLEFSQQAEAKGLLLRVATCSAIITSDAELLENILRNLVSNAVRYTSRGKILIGCRRTASGIRLGVYDTGIGIADEQRAAIFEEFFQIGNHERDRSQGLGLGLSIAQRQACLIRAPLTLRSEVGRGSLFEIELMLSAIPAVATKSLKSVQQDAQSLVGTLIVVVDDESIILDAARLLLEQWGCEVVAASSGEEALQLLANSPRVPDAIVCDHRLRNQETGVQVINDIRNEFCFDIPAALITGDTSPEQFKAITSGGLPVLHKPLQSVLLRETLQNLIAGCYADEP
jgi:signal transduction histidine kinase/CheY-like chemotaxis protein